MSGRPFSGQLVPIMDRYAHQATSVSIYQLFVISIDRSFSGKNTRIPILPRIVGHAWKIAVRRRATRPYGTVAEIGPHLRAEQDLDISLFTFGGGNMPGKWPI